MEKKLFRARELSLDIISAKTKIEFIVWHHHFVSISARNPR
jgi:hypothetical protein